MHFLTMVTRQDLEEFERKSFKNTPRPYLEETQSAEHCANRKMARRQKISRSSMERTKDPRVDVAIKGDPNSLGNSRRILAKKFKVAEGAKSHVIEGNLKTEA